MSVTIKSIREIDPMREAGRIPTITHEESARAAGPGIFTMDTDRLEEEIIRSYGCIPSFKNYNGYSTSIYVSMDGEVIHGIPSKKRVLQEGDTVGLDVGVICKGLHSDAARTRAVGEISREVEKLIEITRQSFFEGIKYAESGNHLNDISSAIAVYAGKLGCGVVRDSVGHGINPHLHEDPKIPNSPQRGKGIKLQASMTLAIEPMISAGCLDVEWLNDDWMVVTEDGSLSAYYEDMILICDDGPEILSVLSSGDKSPSSAFGEKG